MEERNLNEKESLELISQMIRNTQQRIKKHNGMPFLVWGYVTVIVSLTVWYMLDTTRNYHWHYLWFLIPSIGYPTMLLLMRKEDNGTTTYVDKVIAYIWIVLGVAGFGVSILAMFYWSIPILFIIILLMGIGTALTGLVTKFKPVIVSGFLGMLLSNVCLLAGSIDSILVFAGVFFIMMVIPGHILHYLSGKNYV